MFQRNIQGVECYKPRVQLLHAFSLVGIHMELVKQTEHAENAIQQSRQGFCSKLYAAMLHPLLSVLLGRSLCTSVLLQEHSMELLACFCATACPSCCSGML